MYHDYVEVACRLTKVLREDEKCDVVVALTHMSPKDQEYLASSVEAGIDLVLTGHPHQLQNRVLYRGNGKQSPCVIVESFCNFRALTVIDIQLKPEKVAISTLTR